MTSPCDFISRSLQRTSEKEFGEHVQGRAMYKQSGFKETLSIQNNAQPRNEEKRSKEMRERGVIGRFCDTNATQNNRENSIGSASKSQQNQPRNGSHTGNVRNYKDGEGFEGTVNNQNVFYSKESELGRKFSGSFGEKTTCPTSKSTSYRPENTSERVTMGLEVAANKVKEQGLTEATDFFGRKRKRAFRSDPSSHTIKKLKKDVFNNEDNSMATFKAQKGEAQKKVLISKQPASEGSDPLVGWDDKNYSGHEKECGKFDYFSIDHASHDSSALARNDNDARRALSKGKAAYLNSIVTPKKVKDTLRLFRVVCKSLEEEKSFKDGISSRRVDCQAAKILKDNLRDIKIDKPIIGGIPGVEVNDYFVYRMELAIVGLHRPPQSGIDYVHQGGRCLATSVVASGGYENDVRHYDTLVYVGQGGRITSKNKEAKDQVLERGNLALKNSIEAKNPIRVIQRSEVTGFLNGKLIELYTYDGLYRVTKYQSELGPHKKLIYKFWLTRIPNQPKLVHKKNIQL